MMKTVFKVALPLLVIALGLTFAIRLVKTKPKAKRAKPQASAVLVDTATVHVGTHRVVVRATGTVVPERTVSLQPEIAGVIRWEAEGFEVGRRFKKGERIVRLDDRDVLLAIKQRKAAVVTARFELTLEHGRAHIAKHEWKLLQGQVKTTASGRSLALRRPQKEAAQARIAQAKAALEQARLNLSRTVVRAPFDCIVRDKRATLGQVVSPVATIATLVGTDHFFVQVSIPMNQLSAVHVPGLNASEGAQVRIHQQGSEPSAELKGATMAGRRQGRVLRLLPDLDPNGRMARLVVAVAHPLDPPTPKNTAAKPAGHPAGNTANSPESQRNSANASLLKHGWLPLLIGAYVHAEIDGVQLQSVIEVPRLALHEDGQVWVAKDGKLDIRSVHIVWRERHRVLVDSGLRDGEQIVISPIASPRPGMALRMKTVAAEAKP